MTIQELVEGRIDFKGQKTADDIVRVVLITSTFLSFVIGFAFSSLMITMSTFVLCTVALSLVVLPPWPMFNRHPVTWLSESVQEQSQK
ncbi:microsomal signal peptidase 12 kDa subunit [Suillus fuscotomentosus]|uniref:Signal peptidase complex subunit 1 n=1 Tax=Suillus fuscotomentosus TaxID=1912939 RepID=A0AAD4DZ72_9AGAM|nr:microsomal signal peptidase 12 kDa subunit [Suillus fuscotomentosus]KAG1840012.1 microsomal signal peptidase 12 kDa subunit [Suillus tomentosus]KAG1896815.1 microsomal signal peptidase 12 kDa subunit [Suillus fuscotomentosus]KAG2047628.1 microsomal signal peptidase 12 kDa subunit [Suillus hirtellus]